MPALNTTSPLLLLAVILAAGTGLGLIAQRARLPVITGQIVAGFVLAHLGLPIFEGGTIERLQPLTHFALALIGVTVGAHLNLQRLRNAVRRLSILLVAEAVLTPLLVVGVLLIAGAPLTIAVLLGTLAISTAPATIVALVREARARGVFVKTLIAAVALDNMACIVLFEIAHTAAAIGLLEGLPREGVLSRDVLSVLLASTSRVAIAALIGSVVALLANALSRRRLHGESLATISAISILLTYGLASSASVSPLLACLALGAVQTNLNPERDRLVDAVFSSFEPVILCIFFTLAGMHLSLDGVREAGLLAGLFVLARSAGKLLASDVAMRVAGATRRVQSSLRMALIPQAGVAIGLVILIEEDPAFASLVDLFVAVVLISVTVNEIVGPIATRQALASSGEMGRDRPRLVDFLQEENITTDLAAPSFENATEQLTDLLISSHQLHGVDREALLRSISDREAQVSTCIGGGLAVPHGELPEGMPMVGVMGISRRGLHFDTPDGRPVHCIVLLATPRGERDRHLEVLAALARTLSVDSGIQQRLFSARSPAHAAEILHGEEAEDFNYFLETETEGP
ncbi:MAG: cation:proton antiporter [Myxococcota bacterium]